MLVFPCGLGRAMSHLQPQKVVNVINMDKWRKDLRRGEVDCSSYLRAYGSAGKWSPKEKDAFLEVRLGDPMVVGKVNSFGSRSRQFPTRVLSVARALRMPVFIQCAEPMAGVAPFQRILVITDYDDWQTTALMDGILAVWEWRRRANQSSQSVAKSMAPSGLSIAVAGHQEGAGWTENDDDTVDTTEEVNP